MAVFAVTYTIADRTTQFGTYDDRRNSVIQAVLSQSSGTHWDETTSFILFTSDVESSKTVATWIDNNSMLDPSFDLLVVINLSKKGYALVGSSNDADIDKIMAAR
jgi:hypothetical protein